MKGWYFTSPQKMELIDVEEPKLQPGFVLAEVLTAQASVTEAGFVADPSWHEKQAKAANGKPYAVPCHELCARILEVNEGSKFKIGDRVSALAVAYCGECEPCRKGLGQMCEHKWRIGEYGNAGFQEKILLSEKMICKVADNISNSEAANLQPASDCVCFVQSMNLKLGDTVAIFGGGCLGMFTMQIANAAGAGQTIIVDVKDEILELAKKYGATHVINGAKEDAVKKIKELTNGFGADIAVEAAGGNPKRGLSGSSTLVQAINCTHTEATIMLAAVHGDTIDGFPIGALRMKGRRLVTPIHTELRYIQRAADLMASGQLKVKEMITHSFDGIEHVPDMFEITCNKGKYKCLNPAQVVIKK